MAALDSYKLLLSELRSSNIFTLQHAPRESKCDMDALVLMRFNTHTHIIPVHY